ncbi:MAG: hypothetical protein HC782_03900 [Gammaproteobacteria bacterium]|nr:hypothetical protein [Gammaproteobacteria bacterium]
MSASKNVTRLYEKSRADYFRALVRAWQQVAYAGAKNINTQPSHADVQTLIDDWSTHFQLHRLRLSSDTNTVTSVVA